MEGTEQLQQVVGHVDKRPLGVGGCLAAAHEAKEGPVVLGVAEYRLDGLLAIYAKLGPPLGAAGAGGARCRPPVFVQQPIGSDL